MKKDFYHFMLERDMSVWENKVKYNLSESGVHPMTITDLSEGNNEFVEQILRPNQQGLEGDGAWDDDRREVVGATVLPAAFGVVIVERQDVPLGPRPPADIAGVAAVAATETIEPISGFDGVILPLGEPPPPLARPLPQGLPPLGAGQYAGNGNADKHHHNEDDEGAVHRSDPPCFSRQRRTYSSLCSTRWARPASSAQSNAK